MDHLKQHDLFQTYQSAYRPFHSTETALLRVQNDILRGMDNQSTVLLLLIDLSAAFDTVDHHILLRRLSTSFGLSGNVLSWIRSYLHLRSQRVVLRDCKSDSKELLYGVPQGSVLGPILFSMYTSPLAEVIRKHQVDFHMYADDVQIYISFKPDPASSSSALETVENCVSEIRSWMHSNKLKLNDGKTEAVVFGRRAQTAHLQVNCVSVGNCQTTFSDFAKNLGVVLDKELSMKKQVSAVTRSTFYHLRNISRIRKFLTRQATESLIHALISSRLDYGNSLLSGISKFLISRLQSVQNAAARVIFRQSKYDHVTPLLVELHWLPVHSRIQFKILLLVYKALHGLAPVYLRDLLQEYVPSRSLRSSDDCLLRIPRSRLVSCGDRSFSCVAPRLWNNLPIELRTSNSLSSFKSALKTFLFRSAFS